MTLTEPTAAERNHRIEQQVNLGREMRRVMDEMGLTPEKLGASTRLHMLMEENPGVILDRASVAQIITLFPDSCREKLCASYGTTEPELHEAAARDSAILAEPPTEQVRVAEPDRLGERFQTQMNGHKQAMLALFDNRSITEIHSVSGVSRELLGQVLSPDRFDHVLHRTQKEKLCTALKTLYPGDEGSMRAGKLEGLAVQYNATLNHLSRHQSGV